MYALWQLNDRLLESFFTICGTAIPFPRFRKYCVHSVLRSYENYGHLKFTAAIVINISLAPLSFESSL